jgi:uncharacterized protein involved in exopolysaccharide biosynthesis
MGAHLAMAPTVTDQDNSQQTSQPVFASQGSLLGTLTPLVRHWRLVCVLPIFAGLIAAPLTFLLPPKFTATTTFVPATSTTPTVPGDLASFATQFGVSIGNNTALSPDFFASVLGSRELLRATLLSRFEDPQYPGTQRSLLEILNMTGQTNGDRLDNGIRRLQKDITQRVDRRTGIVTLTVSGRPSVLVAAVANRMVELLNQFNLERLQSQSRARRQFAQERRDEAEKELKDAESEQLRFLQNNRRYADSPLLTFEEQRLARQVQLRQDVFMTLTREYEQARIAEVRDTPLLTVVDQAVPPERRSFPPRKLIVLLVIMASALTGATLAYLRELQRAAQLGDRPEYRSFQQAWRGARNELRAALRLRRPS